MERGGAGIGDCASLHQFAVGTDSRCGGRGLTTAVEAKQRCGEEQQPHYTRQTQKLATLGGRREGHGSGPSLRAMGGSAPPMASRNRNVVSTCRPLGKPGRDTCSPRAKVQELVVRRGSAEGGRRESGEEAKTSGRRRSGRWTRLLQPKQRCSEAARSSGAAGQMQMLHTQCYWPAGGEAGGGGWRQA